MEGSVANAHFHQHKWSAFHYDWMRGEILAMPLERPGTFAPTNRIKSKVNDFAEVENPMTRTLCMEDGNLDRRKSPMKRLTEHTESVSGSLLNPQ